MKLYKKDIQRNMKIEVKAYNIHTINPSEDFDSYFWKIYTLIKERQAKTKKRPSKTRYIFGTRSE